VDELLQCARKYRMRNFYGLFGYQPVFNEHPDNAEGMAKLKRFVQYSVNRWGAYVDFWEFLNEQKADAGWYEIMIPHLRSIDPYHHPITTSWERPELEGIDLNAPHWYTGYKNELGCDLETANKARNWKRHHKPVIVGEQGNHASKEQLQTPGIGGVWDEKSALRMRIRNWTAHFNEIAFIFWNTSYARDGHFMNIWLGPQERQYVHAMQDFMAHLDKDVTMHSLTVSEPKSVRGWAPASRERAAVYLHHFASHTEAVTIGVTPFFGVKGKSIPGHDLRARDVVAVIIHFLIIRDAVLILVVACAVCINVCVHMVTDEIAICISPFLGIEREGVFCIRHTVVIIIQVLVVGAAIVINIWWAIRGNE